MIARSPDVLYCDLYDLQRAGVMVDTRLILDDGELAIHWSMLDLFGYEQWWTGLGEAGADNVVIMPGVSLIEAEQFVDILYVGQNVISNEHFTVIEDTGITEEFVCNNNSDCEDVKLEPYEIYDQVKCQYCGKDFNNMNDLSSHVFSTHRQKDSTCEICGKSFKSLKALLNHKNFHKKVDCESCGKSFKSSAFSYHRKVCQEFKCEECDFQTKESPSSQRRASADGKGATINIW